MFPKLKTRIDGERHDLEIIKGRTKIYFMGKYEIIQLAGDILVGISFVTGSILNLIGSLGLYGNIAYLIGSLSLTVRPAIKIKRKAQIFINDDEE